MDARLDALQQRLGYRFRQSALLTRALTHRSAGADHNERLEFLGDAVLQTAVSALLYERFAGSDEGDLTRVRAHLVREDSCIGWRSRSACLRCCACLKAKHAAAGRSDLRSWPMPWRRLIGAAFLDGGFAPAQAMVQRLFGETIATTEVDSWSKDAKTELQEWLQARKLTVPAYRIVATRGQAHAQTFDVECAVAALGLTEHGEGKSRRVAEQEAARRMLVVLQGQ